MGFHLDTKHPVASDSNDHLHPLGTKNNREWEPFNQHLLKLFDEVKPSTLEFGCAGGAVVRSLMDDGCIALGLEGSDYNQKHQYAEWGVIPDNLFTCDLGYPFTLSNGDGKPYQFDVITAWEFIEHLPEERLPTMMDNIKRHLKLGGYFIGSSTSYSIPGREIQYHQTSYKLDWWEALFKRHGFVHRTDIMQGFDYAYAFVRRIDFNFVFKKIR